MRIRQPPSAEFVELHRRLTERYPCICDDDDSDSPWSDGPLINNFGQKVGGVGLQFPRVDEALPFVIKTATDLGFWVYDRQVSEVHLPNGGILRPIEKQCQKPSKPWWQFWK